MLASSAGVTANVCSGGIGGTRARATGVQHSSYPNLTPTRAHDRYAADGTGGAAALAELQPRLQVRDVAGHAHPNPARHAQHTYAHVDGSLRRKGALRGVRSCLAVGYTHGYRLFSLDPFNAYYEEGTSCSTHRARWRCPPRRPKADVWPVCRVGPRVAAGVGRRAQSGRDALWH
jgi:hypothetical protein